MAISSSARSVSSSHSGYLLKQWLLRLKKFDCFPVCFGGLFQLSEKRKVTIQDFRGKTLVSIREYYRKDGKDLPTSKGAYIFNSTLCMPRGKPILDCGFSIFSFFVEIRIVWEFMLCFKHVLIHDLL